MIEFNRKYDAYKFLLDVSVLIRTRNIKYLQELYIS